MGNGFWIALWQMCQLCFWTARYLPRGGWRQLPRRTLVFGLIIPILMIFSLVHWLGFAIDELLFRHYRKVVVKKPVFVTGIPRSGTTHLQRVLADHDKLTCMQAWECFLAPSITERYVYRFIGHLCQPVAGFFNRISLPFLKKMNAIHSLGLNQAEEDFVTLLPINACFLMVVLFPEVGHYWRLSRFDMALSDVQRQHILGFYHRVMQKHLFFHGVNKRYLCKNPSFMMWVNSLGRRYPDASFIFCEREADKAIPSQLSSLQPTWALLYGEPLPRDFSLQIVMMLAKYYHYLERCTDLPIRAMRLPMSSLVRDLEGSIQRCLTHCGLTMTAHFRAQLDEHIQQATVYTSGHQYGSKDIFDWSELRDQFPRQFLSRSSARGML